MIAPIYREVDNIDPLVRTVHAALTSAGLQWELLLIDDPSEDGSEEVATILADELPIRFETRCARHRNLSLTVLKGLRTARFDRIEVMDADLISPILPARFQPCSKPWMGTSLSSATAMPRAAPSIHNGIPGTGGLHEPQHSLRHH